MVKERKLKVIISLMSFALVGMIAVQIYWIKNAIELEARLFDYNVTRSLNSVVEEIWKSNSYFTSRSMDVYIARLRAYLKEDKGVEIVNLHGTGFKLLIH